MVPVIAVAHAYIWAMQEIMAPVGAITVLLVVFAMVVVIVVAICHKS
jgi:hypothetical protein